MSYLPHLVALAGIWALVVISPGPDFVVTMSRAVGARRAGLAAAAGVVLGTAIWASASAVGLEVVLAHYRWLAQVVRLLGAGYLAWLGLRLILRARTELPATAAAAAWPTPPRAASAFRAGLLTDLGNPKAAVFWTSLFAVLLPTAAPAWAHAAAIGVAVLVAAAWYSAVACAFSLDVISSRYRRAKGWIDRVTGGVLIGLAARLAAER
jgi:threonine efflux protein